MKRAIFGAICASALVGLGAGVGCDDDIVDGNTAVDNSYLYYGYYPADVYYSGYAWTGGGFYYLEYGRGGPSTGSAGSTGTSTGAAGSTGTSTGGTGGGTTTASGDMTMGDVLRAMARGESVCPNQVTITPKMTPNACATDGTGMSRGRVRWCSTAAEIPNGSRFDGTVDVSSTRTYDPACPAGTMVTFQNMTTITNLTRTTANGSKILIPNSSGTDTPPAGRRRGTGAGRRSNLTVEVPCEVVGVGGNVNANRTFSSDLTITTTSNRSSSTINGTTTVEDPKQPGYDDADVSEPARSDACCGRRSGTMASRTARAGINVGTHSGRSARPAGRQSSWTAPRSPRRPACSGTATARHAVGCSANTL